VASVKAIVVSVRLPFASAEEFLQRYGLNVSRGGIYLRARALHPPGTPVTLEVKLQDGKRLLYGNATVSWVTGTRGAGVTGMGFKFITLDAVSRRFLESAAAAMPHARSPEPPVPRGVGPIDTRPDAVVVQPKPEPTPPPSQAQSSLPSEQAGRLVVEGSDAGNVNAPAFEPPTEAPPRTGPIIGIDLGTTNSCGAIVKNGQPQVLRRKDGTALIPSVVALNSRGKLLVGAQARGQLVTNPKWTVAGFKRLLGRAFDSPEVKELLPRFTFEVVSTPSGDCGVKLADRVYALEELSAMLLLEVKALAEETLQRPVHRAVITVPAWYSDKQRLSVREAGRLAGLHVERVVNEPTAAALAWGYGKRRTKRVLVYDLGGGTFDASVLELSDNVYEVVSTGGHPFLGGLDFDQAIVSWLVSEFEAKHAGATFTDRVAMQRVHDAAERAKIALSDRTEARVHVPFVTSHHGEPLDLELTMTRGQLVSLTRHLVDRTMAVCQEVLESRYLRADQIDEILLVGGQARAPLVQERITLLFGRQPMFGVNPEEAVALGAALLAQSLQTQEGVLLIDVLPMSIGVGLPGGRFYPVIPRNTSLPVTRTHRVNTTRDDQGELEITIFQGESALVRHDTLLGTFKVADLPRGPRGSVAVELSFELSNDCLLTIKAKELSTGRQVESTFATKDTPEAVRKKVSALEAQGPELTAEEIASAKPTGLFAFFKRLFD